MSEEREHEGLLLRACVRACEWRATLMNQFQPNRRGFVGFETG
eukprot:SAG11_NODE_44_length_20765_cov_5.183635_26_plen_43_part_00